MECKVTRVKEIQLILSEDEASWLRIVIQKEKNRQERDCWPENMDFSSNFLLELIHALGNSK